MRHSGYKFCERDKWKKNLDRVNPIGGKILEGPVLHGKQTFTGYHKIQWDAIGVGAGVYLYQLHTENYQYTKKMILLK